MTPSDTEEVARKARSLALLTAISPVLLNDPRCANALVLRTGRPLDWSLGGTLV